MLRLLSKRKRLYRQLTLVLALLTVSACGQKGPLYIPQEPEEENSGTP